MSGWVPMPADAWPMIASGLGKPWSEEAARFDLRWHADRGALPTRNTLADRWGWSAGEVRTELRHPERWWDPGKGAPPTSRDELTRGRPALTRVDPGTTRLERTKHVNPPDLTRVDPETTSVDPPTPQRVDPPSPPPSPSPDVRPPAGEGKGKARTPDPLDSEQVAALVSLEQEANHERWVDTRAREGIERLLQERCRSEGWTFEALQELWRQALGWMRRSPPSWASLFAVGWRERRATVLAAMRPAPVVQSPKDWLAYEAERRRQREQLAAEESARRKALLLTQDHSSKPQRKAAK